MEASFRLKRLLSEDLKAIGPETHGAKRAMPLSESGRCHWMALKWFSKHSALDGWLPLIEGNFEGVAKKNQRFGLRRPLVLWQFAEVYLAENRLDMLFAWSKCRHAGQHCQSHTLLSS